MQLHCDDKGSLLELEGDYQLIQEQCRSTIKMVSKQEQQWLPSSSVVDSETASTSTSPHVLLMQPVCHSSNRW